MSSNRPDCHNLLDTIPEGVFSVDRESRITFFNATAAAITGITPKEAAGHRCWEVMRTDCCGEECPLRRTLSTGESFSERIVTMIADDGVRKTVSIATAPLRGEDGAVQGAIETFRDLSERWGHGRNAAAPSFGDIISINPAMQNLFQRLPTIARSKATVLLEGETGTGKELFARAIHNLSGRRNGPFVAVNCGALPDPLLESELFGVCAGAFTDAKKDRPGRFALADGGTILLDEIGETSPAMQVKLLRVLQERTFEPLGGRSSVHTDVRVIAATNRDLRRLAEKGTFRTDLLFRLNVVHLTIPPLRDRADDIPLLADYFVGRFNGEQRKNIRGISAKAMRLLAGYAFPGNVRELENAIEHAFVMCARGFIEPQHLPDHISNAVIVTEPKQPGRPLTDAQRDILLAALKRNRWDRSRTARELGIHRTSLYRKMKALGIEG